MTGLQGLPDFAAPLSGEAVTAFAAYGGGAVSVLPQIGALSDFNLTLTKRADDHSAAGNFAVLDLSITNRYPLDEALDLARATDPAATVAAVALEQGYARLVPVGGAVALPAAMTTPISLGWSAADGARWTQRLDLNTAELIKGVIISGSLVFGARVEFSVIGVAARASAKVSFVPAILIPQLLGAKAGGFVTREDLISRLGDAGLSPGLTTTAFRPDIAPPVADRLIAGFGRFQPTLDPGDPPGFIMTGPFPGERLDWDLSTPQTAPRAFALHTDTLSGLAALDPAKLVRELVIAPLDLGFRDIALAANLPAPRLGVPALGVRLSIPPAPPGRPSGVNQTVTFTPPTDSARITLHIDPSETFAYDLTPFALVVAGSSARQIDGAPRHGAEPWLELQAADFPVRFVHVSASDRLLKLAKITGAMSYVSAGKPASLAFHLDADLADTALAMPVDAMDAAIIITATTADGAAFPLSLSPGRITLDLPSFPGYGPHRVAVQGVFTGAETPISLDFAPEAGTGATAMVLTPTAANASFGYVAASPFKAGYRFRLTGGAWSDLLAPGAPLIINALGRVQEPGMFIPSPFEIDGVALVAEAGPPLVLRYLPASPIPERTPAGTPTLSMMKMPQTAILQLGAQFALEDGAEAGLMNRVAALNPALAGARLQPAAIQVTSAAVKLADDNGELRPLGAPAVTSGFPPYSAIFNFTLNPDQAAQAMSAIGGRKGVLTVEYTLTPPGTAAPVVKSSDVADWFTAGEGQNHIKIFG